METKPPQKERRASVVISRSDPTVIPLDELDPALRAELGLFDANDDGFVTRDELREHRLERLEAERQRQESERQNAILRSINSLLTKIGAGSFLLAVCLLAAVAGLTSMIVKNSKETTVSGRSLMTKSNEPVSTNFNELRVPIASAAFFPGDVVSHLDTLSFKGPGGKVYHRKYNSADVVPGKSLLIRTTEGDTLAWNLDDNKNRVAVNLADGTSWNSGVMCDQCTMINLVKSDDVQHVLEDFYEAVGKCSKGRLLAVETPSKEELVESKTDEEIVEEEREASEIEDGEKIDEELDPKDEIEFKWKEGLKPDEEDLILKPPDGTEEKMDPCLRLAEISEEEYMKCKEKANENMSAGQDEEEVVKEECSCGIEIM